MWSYKRQGERRTMKYIMMRFYQGGGLATFEAIDCSEEELPDELDEFERVCSLRNEGVFIGVISEKELGYMNNEVNQ